MTRAEVRDAVEEYCRLHGIEPFIPSELYDLQSDWTKRQFPDSGAPGCYAFYDEQGTLLYVGKASMAHNLGSRVASYFRRDNTAGVTIPRHVGWKALPPRYVQTIPVRKPYEAPSLEEYLIGKLDPPDNTRGRPRQ